MAYFNPFTATYNRVGGAYVRPTGGTAWNPYADVAQAASTNTLGKAELLGYGIGPDNSNPAYAKNLAIATWAPGLNAAQRRYFDNNWGLIDAAITQAQLQNSNVRGSDVIGNLDIVRQLENTTPSELGVTNRYAPVRWR